MAIAKKPVVKKMAAKKPVAPKVAPVAKTPKAPRRRKEEQPEALMAQDEGYQVAKEDAVKFLHSRRQAMFALARRYHLDADDLLQEGYEVLLTCLRDFQPLRIKEDGTEQTVQFNTFFGVRLEGKALELRNRNPEYQARQAHMADLSDEEKAEFRRTPPLLVQHLDQETTMQETLRGEVSNAKRRALGSTAAKALADGFLEKKLNELIAQERDEKRRAALMHVKLGGVSSFEEIAYHFGVTDSRASQILNELMDAFYVQRLMGADLKSVLYDFRKLKFLPKRTLRLLTEAMQHSTSERAGEIRAIFTGFCPEVANIALPTAATRALPMAGATAPGVISPFKDPFTEEENARFPLRGLEFRSVNDLTLLPVSFRSGADTSEPVHITAIMEKDGDSWPLIVTAKGEVVDGARRLQAARTRGRDKVLCMVRDKMDTPTAMQYRVALNLRQIRPDKMDMYFAICALLDQGLSQQKAAAAVGTSRTNVIVYAKVKEKATAKMRALFEDGYLQITNASSCADLEEKQQDALADFIRTYGPQWGKGPSFNEAYEAAITGKLAKLAEKQPKSSLHMLSFPTEKPEEEADSASHPPLWYQKPPSLLGKIPAPYPPLPLCRQRRPMPSLRRQNPAFPPWNRRLWMPRAGQASARPRSPNKHKKLLI